MIWVIDVLRIEESWVVIDPPPHVHVSLDRLVHDSCSKVQGSSTQLILTASPVFGHFQLTSRASPLSTAQPVKET